MALYAVTAALFALVLARPVMWVCRRTGWVDKPDKRKKHNGAIPLSGGLLIVSSLLATSLLWLPSYNWGLVAAAVLIFAIGFYDDRFPLRARYRFFSHIAAAALLIFFADAAVLYLGETFGPVPISLGILAIPFTLIAIPGVINAYNMVDGADGLSGGQILATVLWLIVVSAAIPVVGTDRWAIHEIGPVLFPVAGALVVFLAYNMRSPWRQRASMFLGDGGSMMLGMLIAWAVIRMASHYGPVGFGAANALWLVAIPLFDLFSAIIRRVLAGQTPMSPDRKHMHHLLIERGMKVSHAVLTMNLAAFMLGGIGVATWMAEVPSYFMFWLLVGLFIAYMVYAHRFWLAHDQRAEVKRGMFNAPQEQA